MRFFTVPDSQGRPVSVIWAMAIIGGLRADAFPRHGFSDEVGADQIRAVDAGGNMAAPLLAQALGADRTRCLETSCWVSCSVPCATDRRGGGGRVLAAASAMAHDLWVGVIAANTCRRRSR